MLQGLKWVILETMRRRSRLTTVYKIRYGHLNGKWEKYLIPNNERITRGSHDFKFRVPTATKNIFKFSFSTRAISEWKILFVETVSTKLIDSFEFRLPLLNISYFLFAYFYYLFLSNWFHL